MQHGRIFWIGLLVATLSPTVATAVTVKIEADQFEQVLEPGGKLSGGLSALLAGPDLNGNGILDLTEIQQASIGGALGESVFDLSLDAAKTKGTLFDPGFGLERLFPAKDGFLIGFEQKKLDEQVVFILTRDQVGVVQNVLKKPVLAAISPTKVSSHVSTVPLSASLGFMLAALGVLVLASGSKRRRVLGRIAALLPTRGRPKSRDQRTVIG